MTSVRIKSVSSLSLYKSSNSPAEIAPLVNVNDEGFHQSVSGGDGDGLSDGDSEGDSEGDSDGLSLGLSLGLSEALGDRLGDSDGLSD